MEVYHQICTSVFLEQVFGIVVSMKIMEPHKAIPRQKVASIVIITICVIMK